MVGYQHRFSTPFRGLAVAAGLIAVPASNYTVLRLALVVRAGTGTGTVEVAGLAGERACGQGPGLAEVKAHDGHGHALRGIVSDIGGREVHRPGYAPYLSVQLEPTGNLRARKRAAPVHRGQEQFRSVIGQSHPLTGPQEIQPLHAAAERRDDSRVSAAEGTERAADARRGLLVQAGTPGAEDGDALGDVGDRQVILRGVLSRRRIGDETGHAVVGDDERLGARATRVDVAEETAEVVIVGDSLPDWLVVPPGVDIDH